MSPAEHNRYMADQVATIVADWRAAGEPGTIDDYAILWIVAHAAEYRDQYNHSQERG